MAACLARGRDQRHVAVPVAVRSVETELFVHPLVFRISKPIQVAPGGAGMLRLQLLVLICRPPALVFFLEQAQGSPGLEEADN